MTMMTLRIHQKQQQQQQQQDVVMMLMLIIISLLLFGTTTTILPLANAAVACTVLPKDHIINTPINCLPVHNMSSIYIQTIGSSTKFHPDFGSGTWCGSPIGIPFIEVNTTQKKYPVTFLYDDESDIGPYAIPLTAPIEGGSNSDGDRHVISIDKKNCILYELYRAFPNTKEQSWAADSGVVVNMSSYNLRPVTWTSADAAGLLIYPSLIKYDDIIRGEINHAIRFTVPQTQRKFIWPARHYASTITNTKYPPMGTRLRLKSSYTITNFSLTNQIILRAMKKYGIILADNGSPWFISGVPNSKWDNDDLRQLKTLVGSNFEVVDTTSLMINSNSGQAKQYCTASNCGNGICESQFGEKQSTCFIDCCWKKGHVCSSNKNCCTGKCSNKKCL